MATLAADIGGTRIKLGVVRDQSILAQMSMDAHSSEGLGPQLPRIADALRALCDQAGVTCNQCLALSVAFPSLIDAGPPPRVRMAYGKYWDASLVDLSQWAQKELGVRLLMDNDARMALLGEWRAGAGRGWDNLVMVTLGTGLGSAAIVQGRLLRGAHGQAGVLGGHMTLRLGGRVCTCGNVGCGEAEASTSVLQIVASEHDGYRVSELSGTPVVDYASVFKLARKGDVCAVALRAECIEVWSALIVNLIHAYDPERVIIGGGIMAGKDDFLPDLERTVLARAHTPWGRISILPAQLGDAAALIGGEALAHETWPI